MGDSTDLTRREALKIAAAAVVIAPAAALGAQAQAARAPKFFTAPEFALVDEITEILIPADAHSGGARAAGAAAFIDGRLAELVDDTPRRVWRDGLARVDALSREMHGQTFVALAPDARIAVVTRMASEEQKPRTDEQKPSTDEARFFTELKTRTIHAYYTSRIGIHDELEYKGNVLLQEFVGEDISKR
jgi:gluconate 2-dehydrogenase gamma chain